MRNLARKIYVSLNFPNQPVMIQNKTVAVVIKYAIKICDDASPDLNFKTGKVCVEIILITEITCLV